MQSFGAGGAPTAYGSKCFLREYDWTLATTPVPPNRNDTTGAQTEHNGTIGSRFSFEPNTEWERFVGGPFIGAPLHWQ